MKLLKNVAKLLTDSILGKCLKKNELQKKTTIKHLFHLPIP